MNSHKFRRALMVGLLILAASGVAEAAVYRPVTDASLVDRSPLAIVGRVENSAFGPRYTSYDLSVERVLKGTLADRRIKIGVPGSDRFVVPGMPVFNLGQRVIVFLAPHPDGIYRVVELMLGAFKEHIVNGSETRAVRDLAGSTAVGGYVSEPSRDFEGFSSWIEAYARGERPEATYARPAAEGKDAGVATGAPFTLLTDPPARFTQFDTGGSVQWFLRPGGSAMAAGGATAFQAALTAFNSEPRAIFKFTYGGTNASLSSSIFAGGGGVADGVNGVMINDPFGDIAGSYNCASGGTLAFGGYQYIGLHSYKGSDHGTINEGEIVMQDGADCAFTEGSDAFGAQVFAHELGHVVGLGHSCGDNKTPLCNTSTVLDDALMRAYAHPASRGTRFGADDIAAFVRLYENTAVVPVAPTVGSPTSTSVTATTATLGGTISAEGGAAITGRGIVFAPTATNGNPTIGGTGVTQVAASAATATFTSAVTGLTGGTVYTFRAYATNSAGTGYSASTGFITTSVAPTLTSPTSADVTAGSATLGGTISSVGGNAVTERGVVYAATATNSNPAIGGTGVTKIVSTGTAATFTAAVGALTGSTGYTFKAYATNDVGTGYTAATAFTTLAPTVPGAPTIGSATAGNASVIVEFTAPVNTGGASINGYVATCGAQSATATASPITVTGLTNGTAVTCTVKAQNSVGLGAASSASNSATPTAGLPTVGSPTSASVTATAATIGGTVSADGGSALTERGLVYSLTSANASPTVGGTGVTKVVVSGTGTGAFTTALTSLTPGSGYSYRAYATNSAGTGYSSSATFTTLAGTTIPRLVNLSTRGYVGTGDNIMIGGFIIGGTGSKRVVIRGRGPSMASLGVAGTVSDPAIRLFNGATPIEFNDNWQTNSNAADITASGQAPAFAEEAALLTTVNSNVPYTVHVTGTNNTTGIGIVEVFELDKQEVPLLNISTRGPVLSGDNILIGGFIIQGDAAQQVLIIAKGPSLGNAPFNVPGSLPDPKLDLYSGATVIESNDNWVDSTNMAAIQATGNAPTSPLESAIIRTLNPGAYTAIVRGVGSFQGIGLVEVYKK